MYVRTDTLPRLIYKDIIVFGQFTSLNQTLAYTVISIAAQVRRQACSLLHASPTYNNIGAQVLSSS